MTYEEKYNHIVEFINQYKINIGNIDTTSDVTLELGVYGGIRALDIILDEIAKIEEK